MPRIVCLCLLLTIGCSSDQDTKPAANSPETSTTGQETSTTQQAVSEPGPAESVKTAIEQGVGQLEEKEYVAFLQDFIMPSEMEKLLKGRSIEEFADEFGNSSNAPELLTAFQATKDLSPEISDDGLTAKFQLEQTLASKNTLTLEMVDDKWRIRN